MKWLINEFAKITGVTVRTLHYYDSIGLLRPAGVEEQNGYRWYDKQSLRRMQEILFLRELDFPLKTISLMLSSPDYNRKAEFREQKRLLILKKERIERLISALEAAEKGETMDISLNDEYETAWREYAAEAERRWGGTDAYREYGEKEKLRTADQSAEIASGMEDIFRDFAGCMNSGAASDSSEAQALAARLQKYITDNFYRCTDEILSSLGQMYIADERFQANIDRHTPGTAQFVSDAIAAYVS